MCRINPANKALFAGLIRQITSSKNLTTFLGWKIWQTWDFTSQWRTKVSIARLILKTHLLHTSQEESITKYRVKNLFGTTSDLRILLYFLSKKLIYSPRRKLSWSQISDILLLKRFFRFFFEYKKLKSESSWQRDLTFIF